MLKRQVLRPPENMGQLIVWRVDSCVPSHGVKSVLFKEIRVTMNLMVSSKFETLVGAFSMPQKSLVKVAFPENVIELNVVGGLSEFLGHDKISVVAAPTFVFDGTQGSVCGMKAVDVRFGVSGARDVEGRDVPANVLKAVDDVVAGDHFVGNFVRSLVTKAVDENFQKVKPWIGCGGSPFTLGNGQ
jgi:hypothetical protein